MPVCARTAGPSVPVPSPGPALEKAPKGLAGTRLSRAQVPCPTVSRLARERVSHTQLLRWPGLSLGLWSHQPSSSQAGLRDRGGGPLGRSWALLSVGVGVGEGRALPCAHAEGQPGTVALRAWPQSQEGRPVGGLCGVAAPLGLSRTSSGNLPRGCPPLLCPSPQVQNIQR